MMEKYKISPLAFSIGGAIILSIIFLFITFWIFYTYTDSADNAKDALATTGSYFGGLATLWAACVAGYFFNDWRLQHDKIIEKEFLIKVINDYENFHITYCEYFDPNASLTKEYIDSNLEIILSNLQLLSNKIRAINRAYNSYYLFIQKTPTKSSQEVFLKVRRSIFYLNRESNLTEKNKHIRFRVIHELNEFINKYQSDIYPELFKNLKAIK